MQNELLIGRVTNGVVIRIVGRGTMQESAAFRAAAKSNLNSGIELLVCDATECEYLDSTFLGCLVGIQKASEQSHRCRFVIAASNAKRVRLFSVSALDHYFNFVDQAPAPLDELVGIDVNQLSPATLGRHVANCHQRLADRGGQDATTFKSIADRLTKELGDDSVNG